MKKILIANGNSDFHSGATQSLYHLALNIKKSDLYIPIIIVPSEGPLVEKLRDNNIKVYIFGIDNNQKEIACFIY